MIIEGNNSPTEINEMNPENLRRNEFETNKIDVRLGNENDIKRCVKICNEAWKGIFEGNEKMLRDRYETFPEGFIVGLMGDKVEGYCNFQLIDDIKLFKNWDEATDKGHIIKSHCPNGDWIMGVGMAVCVEGVNKITKEIIKFGVKYMKDNNKKGCYFAIRIPGYEKYENKYTNSNVEQYVLEKNKFGRSIDPEIRLWERYGFKVMLPPKVFEDYVDGGGDPRSKGRAVLIQFLNESYKE